VPAPVRAAQAELAGNDMDGPRCILLHGLHASEPTEEPRHPVNLSSVRRNLRIPTAPAGRQGVVPVVICGDGEGHLLIDLGGVGRDVEARDLWDRGSRDGDGARSACGVEILVIAGGGVGDGARARWAVGDVVSTGSAVAAGVRADSDGAAFDLDLVGAVGIRV